MPEISVIMGVYNQFNKEELMTAVDSILHQTFQDLEFIIYDDGSHPEAAALLKEVSKRDERILLIGQNENHGLAFSLNACIDVARGKYIARMDADDISYPTRLEKQRRFLEEHPEYGWVGSNIDVFDENGIWGSRQMPAYPEEKDYLRFSPYAHPTVMYRASIFDCNAGYVVSKETLRCEDYEIFMRLREAGLKGANLQEELLCYREGKESYKKRTLEHRWNEAKCRYRNFKKLGILFPKGWLFVIRPLVACLVPASLLRWYKRREASGHKEDSRKGVEVYEEKNSTYVDTDCIGHAGGSLR